MRSFLDAFLNRVRLWCSTRVKHDVAKAPQHVQLLSRATRRVSHRSGLNTRIPSLTLLFIDNNAPPLVEPLRRARIAYYL